MSRDAPPHVWQRLDAPGGTHCAFLDPEYAPTGLLDLLLTPPSTVLDVGCFGALGAALEQRHAAARVVGIEPGAASARRARERIDEVHESTLEAMDFESAGFGPGAFDAIVCADVLEHLYNPWRALERLAPLLAPGGVILASIPNTRNIILIEALARGRWRYEGAGLLDITHLRFFTRAEVQALFAETGYRVEAMNLNLDPRCRELARPDLAATGNQVSVRGFTLSDLTRDDVLELATLQFFVRAAPAR